MNRKRGKGDEAMSNQRQRAKDMVERVTRYYTSKGVDQCSVASILDRTDMNDGMIWDLEAAMSAAEDLPMHRDVGHDPHDPVTRTLASPSRRGRKMTTPDPTTVDEHARDVLTAGTLYSPKVRALAQGYEAQRERIADLEDDVERLRPISPFAPEVLFRDEDNDTDIETSVHGGVDIVQRDHNGSAIETNLTKTQSHQLATALANWAGLDGEQWRDIEGSDRPDGVEDLVDVLLTDGERTGVYCWCPDWNGWNWPRATITHWAPLPKPPEVK